ncbi:MAG: LacI family DNA-binding transcriptional regulator [Lachnospiraceae bacterium]|nr:LacI family DNA-binding transcriptional regulator [Lachnospiraceae bacterium]MBR1875555.1 LacI family DNA-binding transcriptional regulator [Lachnospiraceae bacterium]
MVSMKDISLACGVSVATVSKALNDHSDIGEATKKLVRDTARKMGYFPNASAKQLKTNKSNNIGVLFRDEAGSGLTHDFYANILESLKVRSEEKGYDITFINTNKKALGMTYLEHCRYRGFDGVAIACARYDDPEVIELTQGDLPLVTVDHTFENRTAIISDNAKGMRDLTTYICSECGHKDIAYIHGDMSTVTKNRVESFKLTMKDFGIEVPPEYIAVGKYRDYELCTKIAKGFLEMKNPPTCIICPDDFSAIGVIIALSSMGLKVPEDISVAGYDGINITKAFAPRLTTIRQNTGEMGRQLADSLISTIERKNSATTLRIVVEGTLIKGESVRSLKDNG